MSGEVTVRLATADDAALVARHRVRMFVEIGTVAGGSPVEAAILAASERYLATAIPAGTWIGWIAEVGGVPAGGGAAVLRDSPPGPQLPEGGTMAYLLNFYTETEFRGRGVATAVMRACLAWCRERGIIRIELHASAAGRPVYERLGFVPREGEMRWDADVAATLGVTL